MSIFHKRENLGFSLVEITIVIVVIGILVSLSYIGYGSYRKQADMAKARQGIAQLESAIVLGRANNKNKALWEITGNGYNGATGADSSTSQYCYGSIDGGANMTSTEPKNLPKTDNCWVAYYAALDKISAMSGVNLNELKKGDPYGNPYYIGENEAKFHQTEPCVRDVLSMFVPGSSLVYLHAPGPSSKPAPYGWRYSSWGVNPPETVAGVSIVDTYNIQRYLSLAAPNESCL